MQRLCQERLIAGIAVANARAVPAWYCIKQYMRKILRMCGKMRVRPYQDGPLLPALPGRAAHSKCTTWPKTCYCKSRAKTERITLCA